MHPASNGDRSGDPIRDARTPCTKWIPACEENLGGATAAGRGEIAFVEKTITESEITETIEVDVLVCGQGPAGMAAALACAERVCIRWR